MIPFFNIIFIEEFLQDTNNTNIRKEKITRTVNKKENRKRKNIEKTIIKKQLLIFLTSVIIAFIFYPLSKVTSYFFLSLSYHF